ncbi:hypothetical protein DBR11_28040 [Pedobacter sp. HMWF019]|uniref:FecR family protein n=1 Tax=Pedobacter sp. HMWF019 TaxID=2056856 RepID=UPI000D399EB4|nr:FecR family protein [Pedobacter sp. HMWF019]PTS91970.1 hypothetical protein DBR11_28040 [Pedobacter sp. HMWF019]
MNLQQVKKILILIANEKYSDQQLKELYYWLDRTDLDEYTEVLNIWENIAEEVPCSPFVNAVLLSRIEDGLDNMERAGKLVNERKKWLGKSYVRVMGAAASLLLIAFVGLFFYYKKNENSEHIVNAHFEADIPPGGNRAMLILADGSKVNLNDLKKGQVVPEKGVQIVKSADGQLVYSIKEQDGDLGPSLYNTIQTPVGGQYLVYLPDGSKVWLNAASSLRYPLAFSHKERIVELTGEAYFEVAKDKAKPFQVRTTKQTVEVLGTHFNVNSYMDETDTKTTLVEGSVRIHTVKYGKTVVLVPGDQAQVSEGEVNIKHVDVNDAAAWKDGFFVFNDENIPSVMRKISRWYDVEVIYEGNVSKDKDLAGSVSKFSNVSEILKTLELTRLVHFKVNGKKITVIAN